MQAVFARFLQEPVESWIEAMILDLTLSNFRSFRDEQMLSLVAESGLSQHRNNLHSIENSRISALRSAVIFGANASGKSNILRALHALQWLITSSGARNEGSDIPVYEPYKLSAKSKEMPITIQVEFVVPSGIRYRYEVSYTRSRIITELLHSFKKGQKALIFRREPEDNWETITFGGTFKGGSRRFPFFDNSSYISRAGNDASAPASIREIFNYFRSIRLINAGSRLRAAVFYENTRNLERVSRLLSLFDTGVTSITAEENPHIKDVVFPTEMPDEVRKAIIDANKLTFSFWTKSEDGDTVAFDEDEISDGTLKLFEVFPLLISSLARGFPIFIDEIDGHLHTEIVSFILDMFNDPETNPAGAQIVFTTHDTNVLNPKKLRRDQVWFVKKENGVSHLSALDSFDKRLVRHDSPFESFYLDGRFGALPFLNRFKIKELLSSIHSDLKSAEGAY